MRMNPHAHKAYICWRGGAKHNNSRVNALTGLRRKFQNSLSKAL